MEINILPKLKPLYANLLRIDIEDYLISSHFDHFLLERDLDKLWNQYETFVRNQSNVVMLIPGYTGDAKKALAYFLDDIFQTNNTKVFAKFLNKLLLEYMEWKGKKIDINKIITSIENLGIEKDQLNEIFEDAILSHDILPKKTDKAPEFKDDKESIDEKLCFVLMPFTNKFDSIYNNIIKVILEKDFKLKCKRADEIFGTKPIIEDIWEYIQKAKFLIADLTERNANVFYELGIAHALNKQVILITQDITDVPFDLRHFRCIVYEDSIAGAESLKEGLKNSVKEILKK